MSIRYSLIMLYSLWFINTVSKGQTCNENLGDPVINQTFGNSISKPLAPNQTTYKYIEKSCPNDGEYTIINYTTCYTGTWLNVFEDHTSNDIEGNMLLINAAAGAGEFYSQSVTGLCNGTTYEFSVWVLNLMSNSELNGCNQVTSMHLDPDITMKIESLSGKVLQTIQTGTVPRTNAPNWIRYATQFTTFSDENSVIIKLINNGPGGCGNDLALDDIQLRPCLGTLRISFQDTTGTKLTVCELKGSKTMTVKEQVVNYVSPVYQWQVSNDSTSWDYITGTADKHYTVPVDFSGNKYYRVVCTSVYNATKTSSCITISNSLVISATLDCRHSLIFVPDAFTPNGDGFNDQLQFFFNSSSNEKLDNFVLNIYNRWGNIVFVSYDLTNTWDGYYLKRICEEGLYTWKATYQIKNNSQIENFNIKGQVLLLK